MPATRRQYLRRRLIAGILALPIVAAGIYVPSALLTPLDPSAATASDYTSPEIAPAELDWPGYGASAVGAVDRDGVLASNGTDTALPIASISKVVTALVVLDSKPLGTDAAGPDIEFTSTDVGLYSKYLSQNGTVRPVREGMVLTQRQLLDVVLVASANNYAESLADWAFGSPEAFVTATEVWLTAHDLTDTTLVEPTGMSPLNVSSASDLVEIGKLALADPVIAAIVGQETVTVPYIGVIENTNQLLGIDGVDGIKTGTLDEAGACLLFSADYTVGSSTVTVVGVVLGGVDHDSLDAAVLELLDDVEQGFHDVPLVTAGQVYASYRTPWGQTATAVAGESQSVTVWSDTGIDVDVETSEVTTGDAGDTVGSVTFAVGESTIEVPLVLASALDDPGPVWRLLNPLGLAPAPASP